MIQAGTITIGSGRTVPVVGAYWIISASRVRWTTAPGVMATCWPGTKSSAPSIGWFSRVRRILGGVAEPANEIHAAGLEGGPLDLGVADDEVRRREDVEELAADEIEELKMMSTGPVHVPRRLVPPPFGGKVGFGLQRERPLLPGGIAKPPILRQGVRIGLAIRGAASRKSSKLRAAARTADQPICHCRAGETPRWIAQSNHASVRPIGENPPETLQLGRVSRGRLDAPAKELRLMRPQPGRATPVTRSDPAVARPSEPVGDAPLRSSCHSPRYRPAARQAAAFGSA